MMRKYCLSYDAINSKKFVSNELKIEISKVLIAAGALNLQNPVASTILFEDNTEKNRIKFWNGILINAELNKKIYYYLCLVAYSSANDEHHDRNEGDVKLEISFHELLRDL